MESYDIPVMSADTAISQLEELYAAAWQQDCLKEMPSAALWGGVGVGKSTLVHTLASRLSARFGQEVEVRDVRLLQFSPIDLRGVPAPDAAHEFTVWLKPKLFDLPADRVSILFLDEISAAPQSIQAAAYQIALDKRIGEFLLPQNTIVICAGNRTTDRSVAYRMPKALANRLLHMQIEPDYESWVRWAVENDDMDPRIIGYLSFDQSRLNAEPGMEALAFPTPRSWEFVSRVLKTTGKEPDQLHGLISGCVGVSQASEFETWCRSRGSLPRMEDILNGCATPVKKADALYAVTSSLLTCVRQRRAALTPRELTNVCGYVNHFPMDFAVMVYQALLEMEGMKEKLLKCTPFISWMKQNKQFI